LISLSGPAVPELKKLALPVYSFGIEIQGSKLVDVAGIEPATPCLQSRCSPS
jgi:hypothetical protein